MKRGQQCCPGTGAALYPGLTTPKGPLVHGVVAMLPWGGALRTTSPSNSHPPLEPFFFLRSRMPTPSIPCLVQRSSHTPIHPIPRTEEQPHAPSISPHWCSCGAQPPQLGAAGSHGPPRHMPCASLVGRHSCAAVGSVWWHSGG